MRSDGRMARLAAGLLLVASSLVAARFGLPKVADWNERQLVRKIVQRIDTADDADVRTSLRQLAKLGLPATEALVPLASSDRAAVATVARQIINRRLENWRIRSQEDPRFDLATPITTLAKALAQHIDQFGPSGKQWSEAITLKMIDLATDFPGPDLAILLESSSRLFDAIRPRGPRLRSVAGVRRTSSSQERSAPMRPIDLRSLPTPELVGSLRDPKRNRLTLSAKVSDDVGIPVETTDRTSPKNNADWTPDWKGQQRHVPHLAVPEEIQDLQFDFGLVIEVPSPAEMENLAADLRKVATDKLLRRLSQVDRYQRAAIRRVLS